MEELKQILIMGSVLLLVCCLFGWIIILLIDAYLNECKKENNNE